MRGRTDKHTAGRYTNFMRFQYSKMLNRVEISIWILPKFFMYFSYGGGTNKKFKCIQMLLSPNNTPGNILDIIWSPL